MSATISHPHHRMPLLASLSVVAVIAAAGFVGVALHNSATSDSPSQGAPAAQTHTLPSGQAMGGVDGHVPPTPPQASGGRTQIGP